MIAQIRPAAFSQWLQSLGTVTALVLDVREPWEHATAMPQPLPDAPTFDVLPMPMQSIAQRLTELPQDRPIACLCHHGVRSQHVAAFLLNQGFEQVVNIAGGIDGWSRELDNTVPSY
ncbi:MAG: sulfurtransferase [Brachymonas sp.]|nr:sulfurtransferase [Brachymonas sp.]